MRGRTTGDGRGPSQNTLLHGAPWRGILLFLVPIWVGNVIQQSYYTIDAVILGRFAGSAGLAAVGSSFGLVSLLFGTLFAFTAGLAIPVSQAHGSGDPDQVSRRFWAGAQISVATAASAAIALLLTAPTAMELLGVPADIRADATLFYALFCVGLPVTAFANFCTHAIRGLGDSLRPTVIMACSCILNVVLALWLVAGLGLGVLGAGLATLAAGACTALLSIAHLLRRHPHLRVRLRLPRAHSGSGAQAAQGGAMAVQSAGIGIGNVLLQVAANSLGSATIAGISIGMRVEGFALAPLAAFGICMVVYCAQNHGAGDIPRVRQGVRQAAVLSVGLASVEMAVVLLAAPSIATAFVGTADVAVIETATLYIRVSAAFYPLVALIFLLRAALQGLSITRPAVVSGLAELVAKSACAAAVALGGGLLAITLSSPTSWAIGVLPLIAAWTGWRRSAGQTSARTASNDG